MSHTSAASFLVWTLITAILGIFLIFHLWSFDRFKCLKWNSGPYSGAFKRIMTYSYMCSIPLIFVYALGNTVIKYREGIIIHPTLGAIPKPYQLWEPAAKRSIFPLMLIFSFAWGLEMVTHLEELCFWLFLVNSGSAQQNWFRSLYFKTWVVGSCIAVIYMPLVTIFTRHDPLVSEAYMFLAGSLGSLSLTLWFTPILWTFPTFLKNLRREGVDTGTIVRLTKFSELNVSVNNLLENICCLCPSSQMIRVVFRFLFIIPILILGVDGVRPHHHINESVFWTDFLVILSGFGIAVSSGITLVIFFPRSIEGEIAARDASKERKRSRSLGGTSVMENDTSARNMSMSQLSTYKSAPLESAAGGRYLLTSSPVKTGFDLQSYDGHTDDGLQIGGSSLQNHGDNPWDRDEARDVPAALPVMKPNRKRGRDVELGGIEALTETNLSNHNLRLSNVNPMLQNFTSPIDFAYSSGDPPQQSRLTFNRR
ncbi:hypothetical protein K443DRAFT_639687 [Laccaria amethystina LaAM-08-1]|uniref:Uncharacterized protein n=1 Tax=Laccaria amethystina LaAM-08-1 TaxID=1095629 RepID=A0A0C9WT92_9AGAR|nr:hypothetical protein K443DRAFT_639687 [Laccaria amethystina LaAM-08-1]